MGSGKTTIGKALSECLNIPVFDTDEEITRNTNQTITEIFEISGEQTFRLLESEMLKKLPVMDTIITTGGGIVLREENRNWMRENGFVIFLNATAKEILKRLEGDESRPLLKEDRVTKVSQILEERLPLYLQASNIVVETTGKTVVSIVNELVQRLNNS